MCVCVCERERDKELVHNIMIKVNANTYSKEAVVKVADNDDR